jgi:hypothetical protein
LSVSAASCDDYKKAGYDILEGCTSPQAVANTQKCSGQKIYECQGLGPFDYLGSLIGAAYSPYCYNKIKTCSYHQTCFDSTWAAPTCVCEKDLPQYDFKCSGGQIYYYDYCGNRTDVKDSCTPKPESAPYCGRNNYVLKKIYTSTCSTGDQYCTQGETETTVKICSSSEVCQSGACQAKPTTCTGTTGALRCNSAKNGVEVELYYNGCTKTNCSQCPTYWEEVQCKSNEYCEVTTSGCVTKKSDGQSCSSPGKSTNECTSGFCKTNGNCGVAPACTDGQKKCNSDKELSTCVGGTWTNQLLEKFCYDDGTNVSIVDCLTNANCLTGYYCNSSKVCVANTPTPTCLSEGKEECLNDTAYRTCTNGSWVNSTTKYCLQAGDRIRQVECLNTQHCQAGYTCTNFSCQKSVSATPEITHVKIPGTVLIAGNTVVVEAITKNIPDGAQINFKLIEDDWFSDTDLSKYTAKVYNNSAKIDFFPAVFEDLFGRAEYYITAVYGNVSANSIQFRINNCTENSSCNSGFCDTKGYCLSKPKPISCSLNDDCPLGSYCENQKCEFKATFIRDYEIPFNYRLMAQQNYIYPFNLIDMTKRDIKLPSVEFENKAAELIVQENGRVDLYTKIFAEKYPDAANYYVEGKNPGVSGGPELSDYVDFKITKYENGKAFFNELDAREAKSSQKGFLLVRDGKLIIKSNTINKINILKNLEEVYKNSGNGISDGAKINSDTYSKLNRISVVQSIPSEGESFRDKLIPTMENIKLNLLVEFPTKPELYGLDTYLDLQGNQKRYTSELVSEFISVVENIKTNPQAFIDFVKNNNIYFESGSGNIAKLSSAELQLFVREVSQTNKIQFNSLAETTKSSILLKDNTQISLQTIIFGDEFLKGILGESSFSEVRSDSVSSVKMKIVRILEKNGVKREQFLKEMYLDDLSPVVQMEITKIIADSSGGKSSVKAIKEYQPFDPVFPGQITQWRGGAQNAMGAAVNAAGILMEVAVVGGHILDNSDRISNLNAARAKELEILPICGAPAHVIRERYFNLFNAYYSMLDPTNEYGVTKRGASTKSYDFSGKEELFAEISNLFYAYYSDPCKGLFGEDIYLGENSLFRLYVNSNPGSTCEQFLPLELMGPYHTFFNKFISSPKCATYTIFVPKNSSGSLSLRTPRADASVVIRSPIYSETQDFYENGVCEQKSNYWPHAQNGVDFTETYKLDGELTNIFGVYELIVIPHSTSKSVGFSLMFSGTPIYGADKSANDAEPLSGECVNALYGVPKENFYPTSISGGYMSSVTTKGAGVTLYDEMYSNSKKISFSHVDGTSVKNVLKSTNGLMVKSDSSNIFLDGSLGLDAKISFNINNGGFVDSNGGTFVLTIGDQNYYGSFGEIKAGEKIIVEKVVSLNQGDNKIKITLDQDNKVLESNESDNSLEALLVVSGTQMNIAPQIISITANAVNAEEKLLVNVLAQDMEGQEITYSINSSRFNYLGDGNFEMQTLPGDSGQFNFKVTVSDGVLSTEKFFSTYVFPKVTGGFVINRFSSDFNISRLFLVNGVSSQEFIRIPKNAVITRAVVRVRGDKQ